jgi:hypothetical protein
LPLKIQINSKKPGFWKEKSVENVVTLEGLPFNSSIISFHIWLFEGQQIATHDVIRNFMYAFVRENGHFGESGGTFLH